MPLSTDPDTLRVPAFMRTRSLRSRMKRPLVLTALDRKQAGVLPEGLRKKKHVRNNETSAIPRPKIVRPRLPKRIKPPEFSFSEPVLDFAPPMVTVSAPEPAPKKSKKIGIITHYYSKIQVAVMKVSASVSVGDLVVYETADGESYEQIIESMEIEREPVFSARKGQEVGLKLRREPRVGCQIFST